MTDNPVPRLDLAGGVLEIALPGGTAIRIDADRRFVAIDRISGAAGLDYDLHDLRGGTYGDFHQLRPAVACFDSCGEHLETGRCPTCRSNSPDLHPAVQEGGEVQPCRDPWHTPIPGHVRGCLQPWEKYHSRCPTAGGTDG